jgi:hypothetical protein
MTPQDFIKKWKGSTLRERQASQEHFLDICRMLGQPTPADIDPHGDFFCFDRGATKTGGGEGWADVWRRGSFGWEYKGKHKDLDAAFAQLQRYAIALENPPLLVVSDMERFRIHTNWTNTVSVAHELSIEDLTDPDKFGLLRALFVNPELLKPRTTTSELTEEAARGFADIAQSLHKRGHTPQAVAHFLNRVLFCLFAEDVDLLPGKLFARLLDAAVKNPPSFSKSLRGLFTSMRDGGMFGVEEVDWFNGGLFDTDEVLPLEREEVLRLQGLSKLNWSGIEPSIFGTLFERGLDPSKRSQLGAHYTDPVSIMRLVNPVLVEPLTEEWAASKHAIERSLHTYARLKDSVKKPDRDKAAKAFREAKESYQHFLLRLRDYRVLDPACGSGNFLYLSLLSLKDIEHRAMLDAEVLGFPSAFPEVGPQCVMGIELNSYAAELARVTIWIGEIQWMRKHGFNPTKNPILKKLEQVVCRDAVLNADGSEPEWPPCDVIVGNPPFIGDKKMRGELGVEYVAALRKCYKGRVPGGADFVCYWYEKARGQIAAGQSKAAGLVATNVISRGANRAILEKIAVEPGIFSVWTDLEWFNAGAAVRVSLICFGKSKSCNLNGEPVEAIYASLAGHTAAAGLDLSAAVPLEENNAAVFMGIQKTGPFEVSGELARQWLRLPNPHGRSNTEVVRPWYNGEDVTGRNRDMWIIDFGVDRPERDAALFEKPYEYARAHVKPTRVGKREARTNENWWIFQWARPLMRAAIADLPRFIVTPETPTHTVFVWLPAGIVPDKNLVVVARADDTTFGILNARFHLLWVQALGSPYGNHPTARRYNSSRVFLTFPFPTGLSPRETSKGNPKGPLAKAIAAAAQRLNSLRENWLNPPEWVDRVPEVVPSHPERVFAKAGHEADLKKRTLTDLYNLRPSWLIDAHEALDSAVAAAYGWSDYTPEMTDEEILARLLKINLSRAT